MKNVLFLLHEYYPEPSAITNCITPIINKFKKDGVNVDVITRRSSFKLLKSENINGVYVYRVNSNLELIDEKCKQSRNFVSNFIYRIIRKILYINYIKFKTNQFGLLNFYSAYILGKKLLKKNKYDVIVSCSYPFTTHKIARRLREKSNCVWIAYQLDPHTYNYTFETKNTKKRLAEEISILKSADVIFLGEENYNYNLKTPLKALKDKYIPLDYALIKDNVCICKKEKTSIHLVYTGTFYDNIREPYEMLKFLELSDLDFQFDIYFNCDIDMKNKIELFQRNNNRINFFYKKSKSECDNAIRNADIIVNVGNTIPNQLPSKVYEAISTGKPIINFYTIEEDTSMQLLKKYPLCINLKLPSNDIRLFDDFCKTNYNKNISAMEIFELYKTSDLISSEFVKVAKDCYESKQNKKKLI